jgi:Mrp family chromosome partitioning ATPase
MIKKSDKIHAETRKAQMELQNRDIAATLGHIKNKILVMRGKGGVGKSSVAAYLSVALAKKGYQVGLMDVDLYGPSIPHLPMKLEVRKLVNQKASSFEILRK